MNKRGFNRTETHLGMTTLYLTNREGREVACALFDAPDLPSLSYCRWCLTSDGKYLRNKAGHLAHRVILGLPKWSDNKLIGVVDHINGDSMDNRRANLRVVSYSKNAMNSGNFRHNTSGVKGVCWDRLAAKWKAYIVISGRHRHLGHFVRKTDAVEARRQAEAAL